MKQSRSLKRILGTEFASALPKTKELPQKNSFNEKQLSFLIKETLNSKLNLKPNLNVIFVSFKKKVSFSLKIVPYPGSKLFISNDPFSEKPQYS